MTRNKNHVIACGTAAIVIDENGRVVTSSAGLLSKIFHRSAKSHRA